MLEPEEDEDPVAAEPRLARELLDTAEALVADNRATLERLRSRPEYDQQEARAEESLRSAEALLDSARRRLENAVTLRRVTAAAASMEPVALAEACAQDARAYLAYVHEHAWGPEWEARARESLRAAEDDLAATRAEKTPAR